MNLLYLIIIVFYLKLVRKFIVNLPMDFNRPDTPDFRKVRVWGTCIQVSLICEMIISMMLWLLVLLYVNPPLSSLPWGYLREWLVHGPLTNNFRLLR